RFSHSSAARPRKATRPKIWSARKLVRGGFRILLVTQPEAAYSPPKTASSSPTRSTMPPTGCKSPISRGAMCRTCSNPHDDCRPQRFLQTVRSFVASLREMGLPVGIHFLALLIEMAGRCELTLAHLRGSLHDAFGGVEHENVSGRS